MLRDKNAPLALVLFAALAALSRPALFPERYAGAEDKKDDKKEQIAQLAKDFKSAGTLKAKGIIIEKLSKLGEGASRPLCDAMTDGSLDVATAAMRALEKVNEKLYEPVSKMVLDDNLRKQVEGVKGIGAMGRDGRPALNLLISRANSFHAVAEEKRGALELTLLYVKTIADVGGDEKEAVAFFRSLTRSTHPQIRGESLSWLLAWAGEEESRRKELLPVIKAGLVDDSAFVPFVAAAGSFGGVAKGLLPELKKLKLSSDTKVREAANAAVALIEK